MILVCQSSPSTELALQFCFFKTYEKLLKQIITVHDRQPYFLHLLNLECFILDLIFFQGAFCK